VTYGFAVFGAWSISDNIPGIVNTAYIDKEIAAATLLYMTAFYVQQSYVLFLAFLVFFCYHHQMLFDGLSQPVAMCAILVTGTLGAAYLDFFSATACVLVLMGFVYYIRYYADSEDEEQKIHKCVLFCIVLLLLVIAGYAGCVVVKNHFTYRSSVELIRLQAEKDTAIAKIQAEKRGLESKIKELEGVTSTLKTQITVNVQQIKERDEELLKLDKANQELQQTSAVLVKKNQDLEKFALEVAMKSRGFEDVVEYTPTEPVEIIRETVVRETSVSLLVSLFSILATVGAYLYFAKERLKLMVSTDRTTNVFPIGKPITRKGKDSQGNEYTATHQMYHKVTKVYAEPRRSARIAAITFKKED
jgi:hypothetical protein